METKANSVQNVLRLAHVKKKLKISGSTIYNKLNPNCKYFDETFPKPIRLSVGAVGWLESEIDHWINVRQKDFRFR